MSVFGVPTFGFAVEEVLFLGFLRGLVEVSLKFAVTSPLVDQVAKRNFAAVTKAFFG